MIPKNASCNSTKKYVGKNKQEKYGINTLWKADKQESGIYPIKSRCVCILQRNTVHILYPDESIIASPNKKEIDEASEIKKVQHNYHNHRE